MNLGLSGFTHTHLFTAFVLSQKGPGKYLGYICYVSVVSMCMIHDEGTMKQTQKEGYKYTHIQRQTDRQREQ